MTPEELPHRRPRHYGNVHFARADDRTHTEWGRRVRIKDIGGKARAEALEKFMRGELPAELEAWMCPPEGCPYQIFDKTELIMPEHPGMAFDENKGYYWP